MRSILNIVTCVYEHWGCSIQRATDIGVLSKSTSDLHVRLASRLTHVYERIKPNARSTIVEVTFILAPPGRGFTRVGFGVELRMISTSGDIDFADFALDSARLDFGRPRRPVEKV